MHYTCIHKLFTSTVLSKIFHCTSIALALLLRVGIHQQYALQVFKHCIGIALILYWHCVSSTLSFGCLDGLLAKKEVFFGLVFQNTQVCRLETALLINKYY